ncbi:MAG: phosphoribosyl-AMP cyclohydrolase [Phycisphaeraceae bacterium]|nr:phosphoribosyl-AMP cyclohydrolase [Phycisphaeraceae bacterium]
MSDAARETGLKLDIKFNEQGLVPAIVQDLHTRQILMMGWMNDAALRQTLATRKATFYSRSRNKMWVKGEESGHIQEVVEARVDCDQDVILLLCKSHGPACHVGYHTCFYRVSEGGDTLKVVESRVFDPKSVYKK